MILWPWQQQISNNKGTAINHRLFCCVLFFESTSKCYMIIWYSFHSRYLMLVRNDQKSVKPQSPSRSPARKPTTHKPTQKPSVTPNKAIASKRAKREPKEAPTGIQLESLPYEMIGSIASHLDCWSAIAFRKTSTLLCRLITPSTILTNLLVTDYKQNVKLIKVLEGTRSPHFHLI